jgi:hypothetical protein
MDGTGNCIQSLRLKMKHLKQMKWNGLTGSPRPGANIRESVDLGHCVLGPLTHFVATITVRL